MSKRQSKTGVPHLVFQANTGFQYYLTFPKHFAANPKLPAQIRWSLSHDEALARDLARYLNTAFEQFLAKATERLTAADLETRELVLIRRQAIELGQFLYSNRLRFRQERIQWMKTFQPRANETNTPNNAHRTPVEFRVRLSDSSGFAVEFSVGGYRELDERCRAAFLSWQALHPREKRKPGWFAQQELDELEAQSLLAHEELRACELELREATEPMSPYDISGFLHKIQALRQHVERFKHLKEQRLAAPLREGR